MPGSIPIPPNELKLHSRPGWTRRRIIWWAVVGLLFVVGLTIVGVVRDGGQAFGIAREAWHTFKCVTVQWAPHRASAPITATGAVSAPRPPSGSLRVSPNRRYLVDQNNAPFLIVGDSPQALIGNVSLAEAEMYFAARRAAGVNAVWINLLCSTYVGCRGINTYDDLAPFNTAGDLTTPNENYFSRADAIIRLAAQYSLTVFLDPIETGGWLSVLESNGVQSDYGYGVYLGNRYRDFPNIVWLNGNDFESCNNADDDTYVSAVAQGILSADQNHLQTVELNIGSSDSLQDPTWTSVVNLNSAYSYYPQYDVMLHAYNRPGPVPVYFIEGAYEFQTSAGGYLGPRELRAQEYWVMLSGASGQLYGNANLYAFPAGWKVAGWDTTPGFQQFMLESKFFASLRWYDLVPDQNHTVVTDGYGTYSTTGFGNTSTYATAARTPDGGLVVVYLPTRRAITVDLTRLAGPVRARWFDPTDGTYSTVPGSPFPNTGLRQYDPAVNNHDGDVDWVLVLDAQ